MHASSSAKNAGERSEVQRRAFFPHSFLTFQAAKGQYFRTVVLCNRNVFLYFGVVSVCVDVTISTHAQQMSFRTWCQIRDWVTGRVVIEKFEAMNSEHLEYCIVFRVSQIGLFVMTLWRSVAVWITLIVSIATFLELITQVKRSTSLHCNCKLGKQELVSVESVTWSDLPTVIC